MKKILKILLLISIFIFSFADNFVSAENIKGLNNTVKNQSIAKGSSNKNDVGGSVRDVGFKIINIVRIAFFGILVIFVMYAGATMIFSSSDDEDLSKAKRSFRHILIGILFINFPIVIYNAFINEGNARNNFLVSDTFVNVIYQVISFVEYLVAGVAILALIIIGIKLILSRGKEDRFSEAKNRILWIIIGLIFIGFIEVWKNFISLEDGSFNINKGIGIFAQIANLALYFAGPIALFFLVLAGYYYITAAGDEERVKKGKNIIINTTIGVIILLCAFVFLNDINTLII